MFITYERHFPGILNPHNSKYYHCALSIDDTSVERSVEALARSHRE